ncbi:hypothetical protein FBD94_04440 [Pedobacter hiemivivus]|uniref:Uncharacterized protein n=1 Tax=Pedobacter hiemivivus TaxID=2530454 RepID=A0A4V2MKU5_9SPHI|nr:hypothetical protein [Pedobacter hiemivivus]TCC99596.1 hypothetical protein EZ444_02665 [Pedobacter hiemivivus]TKC63608.1 hypothetical protein FBD94_04440 [Pedobacter hiemivivus]
MKLVKIMMACFIFTLALTFASCKKEEYSSRDTSGIVPEPVIPEPVDPTLVLLDNADKLDEWEVSGGTGVIETVTKKEGEGAVGGKFKVGDDYLHFIKRLSTPVNSKLTADKAQLSFWLYVEKPLSIKEGQIEITSSGQSDQQEFHWDVPGLGLKPGWNEVKLKISNATADGGGADLSTIKWFRMYIITTAKATEENKVIIDYVRLSEAPPEGPSLYLDNCDNLTGWEVSGGTGVIDVTKKKEGTGSIFGKTHPDAGYLHFKKKFNTPVDTKLTKLTGQLSFWLYISKAATLNGQIEISSSGDADQQEYNWDPVSIKNLKPGAWNEVKLNIRDAAITNGPVNLAAINYFRMFLQTGEDGIDIGIDGIKFNGIPLPDAVFLDNADLKDGWQTVGEPVIEATNPKPKEGAGFLKNTIKKGDDFMQFIKDTTVPVNSGVTEANGQFKFWWYISDVSALKADGSIEITSSGKSDEKESAWDITPLLPSLKNGWNEITLDLDKSNKSGDGGADYKAINHFRIFFFTKDKTHEDVLTGIDDLKFVMKP